MAPVAAYCVDDSGGSAAVSFDVHPLANLGIFFEWPSVVVGSTWLEVRGFEWLDFSETDLHNAALLFASE